MQPGNGSRPARADSRGEPGQVRNGGVHMTQRNKPCDGNDAGTQTQNAPGRNVPAPPEESARPATRVNSHPLRRLHDEIDTLFEPFFGGGLADWGGSFGPLWATNVEEVDNEIRVR